jgi:hypothetical protein
MQPTILRHATLLLICTVLAACASISLKDRMELLDHTQHTYESAVRWGHFENAYAMHRSPDGSVPTPDPKLNNYKVTSYRVLSHSVAADQASSDQVVQIKYYHVDYMIEKTLTLQQHWRYDAPTDTWLITSAPPEFE